MLILYSRWSISRAITRGMCSVITKIAVVLDYCSTLVGHIN